ncbi:probable protein YOP1 [Zygosaccharomyces bailii]|nr:probable protein YOP1 [Zygosaccharomyces bailii]
MSDFSSSFQTQMKSFDSKYSNNRVLQQLEEKTNLPKSYITVALAALYLILIFVNVGGIGEILSNFAGFVVPAYYSLVAIRTTTSKDDTQLLTYWIVFAFLSVVEFWSKAILYLVPFYWFVKTVFLLYIALPQTGGAVIVYNNVIAPVSDRYITVSETKSDEIKDAVNDAAGKGPTPGKTSGFSLHH